MKVINDLLCSSKGLQGFTRRAIVTEKMKSIASAVLFLLIFLPFCDAVVFSWLWHSSGVESRDRSAGKWNDTNVKAMLNETMDYCISDHNCGKGKYCHRHYGTCHKCKKVRAQCRRDHVCCEGFECVFGKCRKLVKKGNYFARCKKDKQCKKGLCCARSHGESVCKPMRKVNQICAVLEGGLAYAINHGCPCEAGLMCIYPQHQKNKGNKHHKSPKRRTPLRRCVKIPDL